ncbi:hypothetical protein DV738_g1106, partial [Chaetothyriales sp. CBS 135597]
MSSNDGPQKQSATTTTDTTSGAGAANLSGTSTDPSSSKTTDVHAEGRQLSKEEADRLYEERIEEEYAKREGGA